MRGREKAGGARTTRVMLGHRSLLTVATQYANKAVEAYMAGLKQHGEKAG